MRACSIVRARGFVTATLVVLAAGAVAALLPGAGAADRRPPPPNDDRVGAQVLQRLPSRVAGTTIGATANKLDPTTVCPATGASVWYRFHVTEPGRMAVRLSALGQLEAVVAVYRRDRSRLVGLGCSRTDAHGLAGAGFPVRHDQTYLVLVAQQRDSIAGRFELRVQSPEAREKPPGQALPNGGTWSSVDRLLDLDDVWSADLQAGTVYRINLVHNPDRCLTLRLYQPALEDLAGEEPLERWSCAGYQTYTPGPDGGGRYSLRIDPDKKYRGTQAYRFEIAAASPDDAAPGIAIQSGARITGSLSPRTIDTVDLYRFVVPRPAVLETEIIDRTDDVLDLLVVDEDGHEITCRCDQQGPFELRLELDPEHYYVGVRANTGPAVTYRMRFFVRDVTTIGVLADGLDHVKVVPKQAVALSAAVRTSLGGPALGASGGTVRFQFDRRDPLSGWNFVQLASVRVGTNGSAVLSWTPPTPGRWRAHAVFLGTETASPSESGYVLVDVEEPLEQ